MIVGLVIIQRKDVVLKIITLCAFSFYWILFSRCIYSYEILVFKLRLMINELVNYSIIVIFRTEIVK